MRVGSRGGRPSQAEVWAQARVKQSQGVWTLGELPDVWDVGI